MPPPRTIYLSVRLDDGELDLLERRGGELESVGGGTCTGSKGGYAVRLDTPAGPFEDVIRVVAEIFEPVLCARLNDAAEAAERAISYHPFPR